MPSPRSDQRRPALVPLALAALCAAGLLSALFARPALAQGDHEHTYDYESREVRFALSPGETRTVQLRCPKGYTLLNGMWGAKGGFMDPIHPSHIWEEEEVYRRKSYRLKLANRGEDETDLEVSIFCEKKRTEPAKDDEGSEHEHKLPNPKVVEEIYVLDPADPTNFIPLRCPTNRHATDATVTTPDDYRTYEQYPNQENQSQSPHEWYFGVTRDEGSRPAGEGALAEDTAELSALCHKQKTRRANGHTHEREAEVVWKRYEVSGSLGDGAGKRRDKALKKTLRCPAGFVAVNAGYGSTPESSFRFLGSERKGRTGRRMKVYYTAEAGDRFTLFVLCLSGTAE